MDYRNDNITNLFIKQLIPGILGMALTALFVIVDGIFVGRGIGSDALAAVNIIAPLFTVMTGVGLMFGMGAAIIATSNFSKGKKKNANVVITQSFVISSLIMLLYTIIAISFPKQITMMLGAPESLIESASEYLIYLSCFSVFQTAISSLPFYTRINSPNYSLVCLGIATILNIILDYVFIFIFKWGLFGAAIATGIGQVVATLMLIYYLTKKTTGFGFVKFRITRKTIHYALKNTAIIIKLGFAVLLSEITISTMSIAGNYTFSFYIGVAGVAAFSIINYLFPVVYMIFNAIIQSAQPIISYNHGQKRRNRYTRAFRLALYSAIIVGGVFILISTILNQELTSLFIPDRTEQAWSLASNGLLYFSLDFVFFGINIIVIGYYMSVQNIWRALFFTIIRGILPIICFIIIPPSLGIKGIWLSIPIAEMLTTLIILVAILYNKYYNKVQTNKHRKHLCQL